MRHAAALLSNIHTPRKPLLLTNENCNAQLIRLKMLSKSKSTPKPKFPIRSPHTCNQILFTFCKNNFSHKKLFLPNCPSTSFPILFSSVFLHFMPFHLPPLLYSPTDNTHIRYFLSTVTPSAFVRSLLLSE